MTNFLNADISSLQTLDRQLLTDLQAKNNENNPFTSEQTGLHFANKELADLAKDLYSQSDLSALEKTLDQNGTLNIPIIDGFSISANETNYDISIVAATEVTDDGANHGEMSSMLYLRDHIQTASAFIELYLQDPEQYEKEGTAGRTLLLSALHLLSTPAQLARFNDVIQRGNDTTQEEWPHISLWFDDLEGVKPNGWRNKQDSFQMLAYLTLDAIERDFLDVSELNDAHKQFLGSIVPLLSAVGFPNYESSGSWEEVAAHRTSVMAIETALLCKIKSLGNANQVAFKFLQKEYDNIKSPQDLDFATILDTLIHSGLAEIGQRLPDESLDYPTDSVKFRRADAALAYVLMYDLPKLLAEAKIPVGTDIMTRQQIENLVLEQLAALADPVTNGIIRYENDSYQRTNFHTSEVQWIIGAIKRKVKDDAQSRGDEIDLDEKQRLRNDLTPPGREAAWTHPLGQLASWAASRSLQESDPTSAGQYRELSTHFLNRTLSTVTGEDQWHAVLGDDGQYHIRQVPAYRLPECYITYQTGANEFVVPSPHTPLNWSSVMLKQAVGLLKVSTPPGS